LCEPALKVYFRRHLAASPSPQRQHETARYGFLLYVKPPASTGRLLWHSI
jgi:hypothetical protein